jgi:ABC-type multidrug transport system fused ATPase/permease subunit
LHAEKIFVLEGGKIRQTGSHEELVHQAGVYQGLYEKQAMPSHGELLL